MPKKTKIAIAVILILLVPTAYFAFFYDNEPYKQSEQLEEPVLKEQTKLLFGIDTKDYDVTKEEIAPNTNFTSLLSENGVDINKSLSLAAKCKGVFDIRSMRAGRPYYVLQKKDDKRGWQDTTAAPIDYFIYQHSAVEYVVFDLVKDTVYKGMKQVETQQKTAVGIIGSSLSETMEQSKATPMLTLALSEVFAWAIDFYRLQKGDQFKVIYTENFVEGNSIGIDKILAAVFTYKGDDYYAYYYAKDSTDNGAYYDEKGLSLKKAFLKAPLKFSHITSHYSMKRFHPVLHAFKAHLGTDYAAPTGTPIMTVGDGTILDARYTANNGNYVKVKHNNHITTQYLHMCRIAAGIKPGVHVSQGQVIGFVGSTGLATGPHVCFRYWLDGKQVDWLKQKTVPSDPINKSDRPAFEQLVQQYNKELLNLKPTVAMSGN